MVQLIRSIQNNKWIIVIVLVASFLRLYNIDYQSLWMDEIYTLNVASHKHTFSQIISEVNLREGFPYLYFLIMHVLFSLFGEDSLVARLPSAIFGIISVYFMYKLGKELIHKTAGYIAAILLAINEFSIYYSQDARPYAFYLFSLILSYYLLIKFLKNSTMRNTYIYGIGLGLLLNTNFFSTINVIAQGLLLLLFIYQSEKTELKSRIKKTSIIVGIAFLFFIPNIYKFYTLTKFTSGWIPAPTNDGLTNILKEFMGNSEILIFLYLPLFYYFLHLCFKAKKVKSSVYFFENKREKFFFIILTWLFTVVFVIVLKSYTSSSLYISRYFSSILPAIILILAFSISNIKNILIRNSFIFVIVSFTFLNTIFVKKYYHAPLKTQFREASQFIIENNKNNETVYTGLKYWFDYYLKNNFNTIEKIDLESVINEMMNDSTKVKPFWYIDAHGRPFKLSDNAQQFVDEKFYVDESYDGLDAWTKHFIMEKDAVSKFDIKTYQPLKNQNGDLTKVWIEAFEKKDSSYKISGWGVLENIDSKNNKISIVLINNLDANVIKCQQFSRPDITKAENKNIDYDNSGFISNIQTEKLEIGNYKIGILIENKKEGKYGLFLTDKTIIIN